jgi:hypothetical protein
MVVGEVLELDQGLWPASVDGADEGVDRLVVPLTPEALASLPQVQRVLAQGSVAGAQIQHHRQRAVGVDPRPQHVERQLADGDAHAVGTQVPEAQDAAAVRDDDNVDLLLRPVADHLLEVGQLRGAEIHAPGTAVDVTEVAAGLAHGRGIDDRGELADIGG